MHGQTVERRFRDGVGHVDSFVAQQEHAKGTVVLIELERGVTHMVFILR